MQYIHENSSGQKSKISEQEPWKKNKQAEHSST